MHRVRGASGDVLAREPGISPEISPCAPLAPCFHPSRNTQPRPRCSAPAAAPAAAPPSRSPAPWPGSPPGRTGPGPRPRGPSAARSPDLSPRAPPVSTRNSQNICQPVLPQNPRKAGGGNGGSRWGKGPLPATPGRGGPGGRGPAPPRKLGTHAGRAISALNSNVFRTGILISRMIIIPLHQV